MHPNPKSSVLAIVNISLIAAHLTLAAPESIEYPAAVGTDNRPLASRQIPPAVPPAGRFLPGEVLVKFKSNALDRATTTARRTKAADSEPAQEAAIASSLTGSLARHGLSDGKAVFRRAAAADKMAATRIKEDRKLPRDVARMEIDRWFHFKAKEGTDIEALIGELKQDDDVEFAEPNYEWKLSWNFDPPLTGLPDGTTDPLYPDQWYLTKAGIQQAWNYMNVNGVCGGGNSDVVVAVIDSGVDYNHQDLQTQMWVNTAEIPNNGIDDDNNAFIDDIHGCSVVSDPRSHSGDPTDLHGHGTHVSGIIAAQAFNNKGIIGTAFNTKIMAIRAAQYTGVLTIQDISEGIIYATEQGAEVINMSFGGYQKSLIVEDALKVALSQAVLVASAGNDGAPIPCYPARLPYVIGVASCDTEGKRSWFSNPGDIQAPGESIISSLPDNRYAKWSGTSMAAPIISGTAALMRSFFWQRDIYSNRFLMASILNSGTTVDAYVALTTPPTPGVTMYENWVFDDTAISAANDNDGSIDSGETIHLAIELINRSGAAKNVNLSLRAHSEGGAIDDPYVTITKGTAHILEMGPWSMYDNGFIFDQDGVICGVDDPLIFTVAPDCPNEHVIPMELTITFQDGWDPDNPATFTRISRWKYVVTRGKNVPRVIEEDMTLGSDQFWIVSGPVLVTAGTTLTITEGTQVQFGAVSDDPYNPGPQNGYFYVEGHLEIVGTPEAPVNMFPSYLVSGQTVDMRFGGGSGNMKYTRVRNPNIAAGMGTIDHCYFEQDYGTPVINAVEAGYTIFHQLRPSGTLNVGYYDTCLFDAGWTWPNSYSLQFENNVFLMDIENNKPVTIGPRATTDPSYFATSGYHGQFDWVVYDPSQDATFCNYVTNPRTTIDFDLTERLAQYFGGHLASILNENDQDIVGNQLSYGNIWESHLGLTTTGFPRRWIWRDGNPLVYMRNDFGDPPAGAFAHLRFGEAYYDHTIPFRLDWKSGSGFTGYYRVDHRFILKIPGNWSAAQLNAGKDSPEALAFVTEHDDGHFKYNAFLNKFWDPSLNNWMRINAPAGAENSVSMKHNYWGTDSQTLINYMILDYYDDFTKAKVKYGTPPSVGYESTYPFVDGLFINGQPAQTIPEVGMGPSTFRIRFNRDMSQAADDVPFVTFGPTAPYTDFTVKPIDNGNNGWVDARTWEGTFFVVPVTGDGYHCLRISGAVAADDPWLVTGYDVGRFRFEVKTMGILAMTLHATGAEGRIELSWLQDDFDMLAGYNLYRSTTENGAYEKLNQTIIPPGSESFVDHDVIPAVPMFYKFTVLQTDYTESEPSNIASAAPADTIAPVLIHTPVFTATGGGSLRLTATATDNVAVTSVILNYRAVGGGTYQAVAMLNTTGTLWTVSLSGSVVQAPGIEYYLTCSDGINVVFSGTPALPHGVVVANTPSIASVVPNSGATAGGSLVTISGSLLQNGASILFGQEPATDVEFLSPSQMRCKTPAHYPSLVDVKLVNPDGSNFTMNHAFTFRDENVVLSMPDLVAPFGTMVEVPLVVADVQGLLAASIAISYDPGVLAVRQVSRGGLLPDWSFAPNVASAGAIQLSMAGATAVSGSGNLAVIQFEILGNPPAMSSLTITTAVLNDGAISRLIDNGSLVVDGLFQMSGTVSYFGGGPVPGVALGLNGGSQVLEAVTAADGSFNIQDVTVGSYRLSPTKEDEVNGISSYDASLVLQADAGLISLTGNPLTAADVNRNGIVSAMDASYILQKAVDLLPLPFPGNNRIWSFTPLEREFPLLNTDHSNQDFTAILIGDVSGNWAAPQAAPPVLQDLTLSATLSLPDLEIPRNEPIAVPLELSIEPGTEILAADIEIRYDNTRLTLQSATAGEMIALNGMMLQVNSGIPGLIKIGAAGASPIGADGTMVILTFTEVVPDASPTELLLVKAALNENQITTRTDNGSITILPAQLTFAEWVNEQEIPEGLRGELDCPADDGIPNLTKYACGLAALTPSGNADLIQLQFDSDTQSCSVFFCKSRTAKGVVVELLCAPEPGGPWSADDVSAVLIGADEQLEWWQAWIPDGDRGFARLRVYGP